MIFMGTPALSVPSLELLRAEHDIVLCVTQPDKPAGRGHKLLPSPVKEYSRAHGIALAQPERARDENFIALLREIKPEVIAVVAYGQILPREILDLPRENFTDGGCVNLHFSLLPRWRGAAPVQYAIWKGDTKIGVTTQWMSEKLDAGDIILQRAIPLGNEETSGEVFEKLTPLGAQVLTATMRLLEKGEAPRTPQNQADATLSPTIKKDDAQINWQHSAQEIHNHIRAFNPRPGAHCRRQNAPLKIHRARVDGSIPDAGAAPGTVLETRESLLVQTGNGALELLEVQPPGKPKMPALDWARGTRISTGDQLK
jgi:methionyl-tRNA formyltransferase